MERVVHNANIEHYRRLRASLIRRETKIKMLLTLLAEELATRSRAVSLLASAWIAPSDA
jgi:hypothetical protein